MSIREHILAIAFFVVIICLFFYKTFLHGYVPIPGDLLVSEYKPWSSYSYLGYNPGSYPHKAQYFDTLRQLYPWKVFALHQIKNKELPLWNPYNFSGTPMLANFQSAIFYPLNIFYMLFNVITAWTILVILQPLLSAVFTYFYTRALRLSFFASLFAGVTYAFSSFASVWLEYNTIGQVILWLPLGLLSIEKIAKEIRIRWLLALVASLLFPLFAGHPQVFAYLFLFVLFYGWYLFRNTRRNSGYSQRSLFLLIALLLLSLGIGAIQIIPGLELISYSARVSHTYNSLINTIVIAPWQLIMFFVPDFFGNPATRNYWLSDTYIGKVTWVGTIPIFFIILSLVRQIDFRQKFFLIAAVVVLLLTTFNPVTMILYKLNLPIISSSTPTLSIFLFCFCLSILSGFGIDIWRKEKLAYKKYLYWISPVLILFIFLWVLVLLLPKISLVSWGTNLIGSFRPLLYSSLVFGGSLLLFLIGIVNRRIILVLLVLLFIFHGADLFRSFQKFNPFSPKEFIFPDTHIFQFLQQEAGIYRFWGYGHGTIEANFATAFSLNSADGYDPLYPRRYGEFIYASKNGKILKEFSVYNRSDAVIAKGFGESDLPYNTNRLRILDALGVRYILDRVENNSTETTFPPSRFKLVHEKDGWKVFENLKSAPRAFLTSNYKTFTNAEEFERLFFSQNFDPSQTILLEQNLPYPLHPLSSTSKLTLVRYSSNTIVFKTVSDGGATMLFLSDTYYPGWKAFVDGKLTKIYRANYTFRAIVIPKGSHEVSFAYIPNSFRLGLYTTISSTVLLVMLSGFLYTKRNHAL